MVGRWIWRTTSMTAAVLSAGVALFSFRYLVGGGLQSPEILSNLFARPWLYLHILGAATALLLGALQFLPRLHQSRSHRWIGRVYVCGCLVGAGAGFILSFGSFAGPVATLGFGSLSIVWLIANAIGWRMALLRRFDEHRAWMVRSWSLTLAAVTLRLYLPLFPLLHLSFVEGYRAVSFLSWVPNLVVAELYLRRKIVLPGRSPQPRLRLLEAAP